MPIFASALQAAQGGNLPQAFVHALLLECAATLTGPRAGAS
jgi:hypothetical protein